MKSENKKIRNKKQENAPGAISYSSFLILFAYLRQRGRVRFS